MNPTERLRQFVAGRGIDVDYVSVAAETDGDGDTVRYVLEIDREAPREDIVAFYRMRAVNLVNTDGERTYVFAEFVDELAEGE
jgi:hypothetical protein